MSKLLLFHNSICKSFIKWRSDVLKDYLILFTAIGEKQNLMHDIFKIIAKIWVGANWGEIHSLFQSCY